MPAQTVFVLPLRYGEASQEGSGDRFSASVGAPHQVGGPFGPSRRVSVRLCGASCGRRVGAERDEYGYGKGDVEAVDGGAGAFVHPSAGPGDQVGDRNVALSGVR